jgi:hypothetical protein
MGFSNAIPGLRILRRISLEAWAIESISISKKSSKPKNSLTVKILVDVG